MNESFNIKKISYLFFLLVGIPILTASCIFCYSHRESVFDNTYFILGFVFSIPAVLVFGKETGDKNYDEAYHKCLEIYSNMEKIELDKIQEKVMSMPNKYFAAEKEAFIKAYSEKK